MGSIYSDCNDKQATNKHNHASNQPIPIRTSRQFVIPSFPRVSCYRQTVCHWSITLPQHPNIAKIWAEVSDKSFMEFVLNRPFYVLGGNFSARPTHTSKRVYVEITSPSHDRISWFHFPINLNHFQGKCKKVIETNNSNITTTKPIDSRTAIYTPQIDKNPQRHRHTNVGFPDTESLRKDWTEEVKFKEILTIMQLNYWTCYHNSRHVGWESEPNQCRSA